MPAVEDTAASAAAGSPTLSPAAKRRKIQGDAAPSVRAGAGVEPEKDSLLVIGDGLAVVLEYCDPISLGRCELTRKVVKESASKTWMALSKNKAYRGSLSANGSKVGDVRRKVITWFLASRLAERVEPLMPGHIGTMCKGCTEFSRPAMTDIFLSPTDYEIYVRISTVEAPTEDPSEWRTDGSGWGRKIASQIRIDGPTSLHFEGFVPFHRGAVNQQGLEFKNSGLDLSKWPAMERLLTLNCLDEDGESQNQQFWDAVIPIVENLVVTIVAVPKRGASLGASLVQGSFRMPSYDPDHYNDGCVVFYNREHRGMHLHGSFLREPFGMEILWSDKGRHLGPPDKLTFLLSPPWG